MKTRKKYMYKNKTFKSLLIAVLATLIISSCKKEIEGNCGTTVRLVYTYNILSVDALKNQVDEVTLYIFDHNGILVKQCTHDVSSPIIRLSDLKNGNYHFVAWAQSKHITSEQSYFSIPTLKTGVSSIDELTYWMKRESSGIQRHELNNFLVGMSEVRIGSGSFVTVELKNVTNKIKVVLLPYTPDGTLDVADYEFSVVDKIGNGHINYDYSLLPDDQITYFPYYAANLEPENKGEILPDEIDRAAVVNISTSRLLESNAARLIIRNKKDGDRVIVSMNLPWVISLMKIENNVKWSLQEYLDRQDSYTIMMYFDNSTWMNSQIIINGWVINVKEIDL